MAFRLDLAQEARLYLWIVRFIQTLAQLGQSHDCSIQELQAHSLFSKDQSPQVALHLAFQVLCSIVLTIAQKINFGFQNFQAKLVPFIEFNPQIKAVPLMLTILVIQLSFPLPMLQAY